ncbi:hypothetical protein CIW83_13465 [Tissierella sp. P1]|uniref:Fur family transcriptional regulator n=1 Tax=unclassified Tissierella TaxID=2638726 RepID=UPI000BA0BB9A|nr:Fur family transcriptional regulator [Tissierella sp. P1]OZV11656.1 hypothetical protein CIW83_13465 [Tissierella sp. P1]
MRRIDNKEIFSKHGIKNTKQRNVILDILKKTDSPITAEEIFIRSQDSNVNMNFSTVYRILNTFVLKDIAIKTSIGEDDKNLYELNMEEHSHYLICLSCKKMIKIGHCPLEEYESQIQRNTKFHIIGHKLEIHGYCPECIEEDMYENKN